ncbi:MAG: hypothetical protein LBK23_06605 [Oscillospiraceae bacterium]|jgi:hypothetical protein|nr:hypothetical protein [Oscillospiraceae bacterium]
MQTYKRAWNTLLAGLAGGVCGGLAVAVVVSFFNGSGVVFAAVTVVVCGLIWYITIFSEAIYFTVADDGIFRYYKRGKQVHEFDLKKCYVGYYRRSRGASDHNIQLKIQPVGGEEAALEIDASPLGRSRFEKMFARMEALAANKPEVLSTDN